ncbi:MULTISPECIES: TetR/AcrR family transcriptional regulator [Caproicibacterium]|uniref:TetR/AcrR family transcriptional regulator n=1 Tax=Caproicibacterium argilliputei TaxID=3030016 RepID=A0AA97DBA5_9FIRM|nr:TetR/AcrR family transcriptional regulator [Caproicibacterium argilliputei]WOC32470.1 TetR/AcrR family transcriptional regulator [Caproicibacterium argilliputei]
MHDSPTLQRILEAGKQEFLKNGFRAASLRQIVKEAGVTTGAFYGYFPSKESLFTALVRTPAQTLLTRFTAAQKQFAALPHEEQLGQMGKISGECMDWMVLYIYAHFDVFKLIICCADGTTYAHYLETMTEIETESTHRFIQVQRSLGKPVKEINCALEHILISGMFSALFEMVRHDMPQAQAVRFVKELKAFYSAGWKEVMGY